jgi:hypothetical protein
MINVSPVLSVLQNHWLVKFYCAFGLDGMLEDTRMYASPVTVATHVTSTEISRRGYKQAREGRSPKSLVKVKWS